MSTNFFENEARRERILSKGVQKLEELGQKSRELKLQEAVASVRQGNTESNNLRVATEQIRQSDIQKHLNNERAFVKDSAQDSLSGYLAEGFLGAGANLYDWGQSPRRNWDNARIKVETNRMSPEQQELVQRELQPQLFEREIQGRLKELEEARANNIINQEQYQFGEDALAQLAIDFHTNYKPLTAEERELITQVEGHALYNRMSALDRGHDILNRQARNEQANEGNWFRNVQNQNSFARQLQQETQGPVAERIGENHAQRRLAQAEKRINDVMDNRTINPLEATAEEVRLWAGTLRDVLNEGTNLARENPLGVLQSGFDMLPDMTAYAIGGAPAGIAYNLLDASGAAANEGITASANQLKGADGSFMSREQIRNQLLGEAGYASANFVGTHLLAKGILPIKSATNRIADATTNTRINGAVNASRELGGRAGGLGIGVGGELFAGGAQSALDQSLIRGDSNFRNVDVGQVGAGALQESFTSLGVGAPTAAVGAASDLLKAGKKGLDSAASKARTRVNRSNLETGDIPAPPPTFTEGEFNYAEFADTTYARMVQPNVSADERLVRQNTLEEAHINLLNDAEIIANEAMEIEAIEEANRTPEQKARLVELRKEFGKIAPHIEKIEETLEKLASTTVINEDDANTLTEETVAASQDDSVSREPLAQRFIRGVTANPDAFTVENLQRVIQSIPFNETERSYLDSVIARKSVETEAGTLKGYEKVSDDIFFGNTEEGWMGVNTYRQKMQGAISTGNIQQQNKLTEIIDRFSASRNQRNQDFAAAQEAIASTWGMGSNFTSLDQLTPEHRAAIDRVEQNYVDKDGNPYNLFNRRKDGSLQGLPLFQDFAKAVAMETKLVDAVRNEMLAARGLKDPNVVAPTVQPVRDSNTSTSDQRSTQTMNQENSVPDAESVNTSNQEAPQPADAGVTSSPMSTFTNHSGGAYGADTAWDQVGREFGVTNQIHYRPESIPNNAQPLKKAGVAPKVLSKEELELGYQTLEQAMGKKFKRGGSNDLLARNAFQVNNSDSVLAIGELTPNQKGVKGGTNYAVQMGLDQNKPVHVWDTNTNQWHTWNGSKFAPSETPTLTPNFAGVGTRDIENYNTKNEDGSWSPRVDPDKFDTAKRESAIQAIRDVYQKTQDNLAANEQATSTVVDSETPSGEPQALVSTPTPATVEPEQSTSEPKKTAKKAKEKPVLTAEEIAAKKEATREKLRAAWKRRQIVRPEVDELLTAIAKLGGVRRSEVSQFSDDFGMRRNGIRWVFTKNGLTLDHLIEKLTENDPDGFTGGYLPKDATTSDLADLIGSSISGKGNYTAEGAANKAELDAALEAESADPVYDELVESVRSRFGAPVNIDNDYVLARVALVYNQALEFGISPTVLSNIVAGHKGNIPELLSQLVDLTSEKLNEQQAKNRSEENTTNQSRDRETEESTSGIGRTPETSETTGEPTTTDESLNQQELESDTTDLVEETTEEALANQDPFDENTDNTETQSSEPKRKNTLIQALAQNFSSRIRKMFRVKNAGKNPLAHIPYFFSLEDGDYKNQIENLLGRKLTDKQEALVYDLKDFHAKMTDFFNKVEPAFNKNSRFQEDTHKINPFTQMLYTRTKDGKYILNDNVVGAISVGVYQWLAQSSGDTLYRNKKDVAAYLGISEDDVSTELWNNFVAKGIPVDFVVKSIGASVVKSLKLGFSKDAPGELKNKIESEAGMLGVYALIGSEESSVSGLGLATLQLESVKEIAQEISHLFPEDSTNIFTDPNDKRLDGANVRFLKVNTTSDGKMDEDVSEFREFTKNTDDLLTELFGVVNTKLEPSLTPIENVTKIYRRTIQKIPEKIREQIKHAQQVPWTAREYVTDSVINMSRETQEFLFGVNNDRVIADRIKPNEAKNHAARESLDYFLQMRERLMEDFGGFQDFYYSYFAAKQGRIHMKERNNPQNDKNHRFLFGAKDWKATIDKNNQQHVNFFKLALAEAFDLDRDKNINEDTLRSVNEFINRPEIQDAAYAAVALRDKNLSDADRAVNEQAIIKVLKNAKDRMHMFEGLSTLGDFLDSDTTSFETMIMPEVDGVANGVILGIAMFAGGQNVQDILTKLERGGLFSDTTTELAEWKKRTNSDDTYMTSSKLIGEQINGALDQASPAQRAKMETLLKNFGKHISFSRESDGSVVLTVKRTAGKEPTMVKVYGSGAASIVRSLIDGFRDIGFLDVIRDQLEDAAAKHDLDRANQVINDFNAVAGTKIPNVIRTEDIYNIEIKSTPMLINIVTQAIGEPVAIAMNLGFKDFTTHRKSFNASFDIANKLFVNLYNYKVKQRTKELRKQKVLYANETLSKVELNKIVEEVKASMPIMNTPYSVEEGGVDHGLFFGATSNETLTEEARDGKSVNPIRVTGRMKGDGYSFRSISAEGEVVTTNRMNTLDARQKWLSSNLSVTTFNAAPSVRYAIGAIHNADSYMSSAVLGSSSVLSVFDGFGTKVGEEQNIAKKLNEATLEVLQFDHARESLRTLDRSITTFLEQSKGRTDLVSGVTGKPITPEQYITEVAGEVYPIWKYDRDLGMSVKVPYKHLGHVKSRIHGELAAISKTRKEVLSKITAINQYYVEGGSAEGPAARQSKTVNTPEGLVEELNKAPSHNVPPQADAPKSKTSNKFGSLGSPIGEVASDIANVFKIKSVMKLRDVINKVTQSIGNTSFDSRLGYIASVINRMPNLQKIMANVEVVAIKPEHINADGSINAEALGIHPYLAEKATRYMKDIVDQDGNTLGGVKGAYIDGKIFLRYSDGVNGYKDHGMSYETLLHEAIHAITVDAIVGMISGINPPVNPSRELKIAVEAVKEIHVAVKTKYETDSVFADKYGDELGFIFNSSVAYHNQVAELVSWSMTNENVQNALKEVDVTLSDKAKVNQSLLSKAFDALIDSIAFVIGYDRDDKSALSNLINATSAIISEVDSDANANREPLAQQFGPRDRAEDNASNMTPTEIFDGLYEAGQPVNSDLREIVETISESLPINVIRARNQNRGIYNSIDNWLDAMQNNRIPFVQKALANGFGLNQQEQYVADQIEVATLLGLSEGNNRNRKEFDRLYDLARAQITERDFVQANEDPNDPQVQEAARRRYDYVFNPKITHRTTWNDSQVQSGKRTVERSEYLARFAAMSMAYKPLKDAVSLLETETNDGDIPFSELIRRVINEIASALGVIMGRPARSGRMDQRINQLIDNLADVDIRNRDHIVTKVVNTTSQAIQESDAFLKTQMNKANRKLQKLGWNTNHRGVKTFATAPILVLSGQVGNVFEQMKITAQSYQEAGRQGFLMALANEFLGQTKNNINIHKGFRWAKNSIDQNRRHYNSWAKDFVNNQFSRELSDSEKTSSTRVLIKTNLQALLGPFNINQITEMIRDRSRIRNEINRLNRDIQNQHADLFNEIDTYTKAMAYYGATGINNFGGLLPKNTSALLNYIEGTQDLLPNEWKALKTQVDQLAALYRLDYTPQAHRQNLNQLINDEVNRIDGVNGLENTLMFHRKLVKEALKTRFDNNPTLMEDGYIPQIQDPKIQVRFTEQTMLPTEARDLMIRGYVEVDPRLSVDPDAPHHFRRMWVSQNDAAAQMAATTVSYHSSRGRGSHAGIQSQTDLTRAIANKKRRGQMIARQGNYNPMNEKNRYGIPLINDQGEVVDIRYEMSEQNRDDIFRRDMSLDGIMGKMAADIVSKNETVNTNKLTVQMLKNQYAEDVARGIRSFIEISPTSDDPEAVKTWNRLPYEMKQEIKRVWGSDKVFIRNDLEKLVFGYRTPTIAGLWDIEPQDRKMHQRMVVETIDYAAQMLGITGHVSKLKSVEEVWTDLVREVKDIWVIKNLWTLVANISSNTSVLFVEGLGPIGSIRGQIEGYNLITQHQKDAKNIYHKEALLTIEQSKNNPDPRAIKKLEGDVAILRDRMSTNPINDLMDAGVFQTIIEDLDQQDDNNFSYKERISDQIDKYTSRVPEGVKTVAREVLMTKRSKMYKGLAHLTQVSDLAARYALYNHLVSRKKNPMTREAAINQVVEQFVNYDLPTHEFIEFGNKYGLLWFTKYYIRTQKVLMRMARENPTRLAILASGEMLLDDVDTIHDSWMTPDRLMNRWKNPISSMMSAPSDLITMQMLEAL